MYKISQDGKYIERFSLSIRIAHWINATSCIMLFITALPLYSDMFKWIYPIFGGAYNTQLLHKIFAIIFLMPTLLVLLTDPKGFFHWTKIILNWKSYDFKFLQEFPKEFFGKHPNIPKQDFFNAGQKINSLLTISCAIIMVISGFIIWFKESFPQEVVLIAYPAHSLGAGLMIAVAIGHVYLSVGHPNSRPSFQGIVKGYVTTDYAKEHHGRWYDKSVKENMK